MADPAVLRKEENKCLRGSGFGAMTISLQKKDSAFDSFNFHVDICVSQYTLSGVSRQTSLVL